MKLKRFKERDHKRIGVIVFTLVCLLLISGAVLYRTFAIFEVKTNQNVIKGKVGDIGDIQFAFYIDNQIVKEAPSKDNKTSYVFDEEQSNCTNGAHVYWDYQQWGPMVTDITKTKTKCYLKFKTEYSEDILNGAVPKIKENLVPVTIDENGTVRKADITQHWYDYGEQRWANSVIKGNSFDLLGSNVHGGVEKQDGYASLNGINGYIDLGLANYKFDKALTVIINVKINPSESYQSEIGSTIIGNQEDGGFALEWRLEKGIRGLIFDGQTSQEINCTVSNPEEYHVYMLKYDGQLLKVYIDGSECQSINTTSNIALSTAPIVIGANPKPNGIDGGITKVDVKQAAVFNRAIEESEIKDISNNNFKITNGTGLLKYVDFTNKTYESGEVISEDNIESYFVWIPRYKYQIWNGEEEISKFNSVQSLGAVDDATTRDELNKQKEIKIEFENKHMSISDGNLKNQWLTHPAFTSFNSNGFWFGKFETGYKGAASTIDAQQNEKSPDKVIIKPNVYSWRNINVSNAFETSKEYKTKLDSHMMKNMEWGAVAYLTNSKYGRCSGDKCTEVRINNSQSFVTGSSAVTEPTCGYTGDNQECNKYGESTPGVDNDDTLNYKNKVSNLSSTTNNYYGIYDLSGGAWEYVMGVMVDQSGNLASSNSEFTIFPEEKYYDTYAYSTTGKNYSDGILGDGTKEFGPFYQLNYHESQIRRTCSWNADDAFFLNYDYPWFARGNAFGSGVGAGFASFDKADGSAVTSRTFRVILTP